MQISANRGFLMWAQEGETEEAEVKEDEGESDKEEVEV